MSFLFLLISCHKSLEMSPAPAEKMFSEFQIGTVWLYKINNQDTVRDILVDTVYNPNSKSTLYKFERYDFDGVVKQAKYSLEISANKFKYTMDSIPDNNWILSPPICETKIDLPFNYNVNSSDCDLYGKCYRLKGNNNTITYSFMSVSIFFNAYNCLCFFTTFRIYTYHYAI